MNIGIVTDDNSGFPRDEAKKLGLYLVPMPVIIDGKEYYENVTLTHDEFYDIQADDSHNIHTAQPTIGELFRVWDEALSVYDQILFIGMSSGLTGTIDTAKTLAQDEKYRGKVFVVDNHRISITLRHSIYDALELISRGKSAEEIQKYLEETAHDSMIYLMVDTLKYLKKGGRVTPAAAALGSILSIKPILKIDGGKLDAKSKQVGSKAAMKNLIKFTKDDLDGMFKGKTDRIAFAMAYTHNEEKAIEYRKVVAEELHVPVEDIMMDPLSLSVAVHTGPGVLAIATSVLVDKDEIRSRS